MNQHGKFVLFGMSSAVIWYVLLSFMFYYANRFQKSYIFNTLNLPFQVANFLFFMLQPVIARNVGPQKRIVLSMFLFCVIITAMTVLSENVANRIGYWLTVVCAFILGALNSIVLNTFIGYTQKAEVKERRLFKLFKLYSGFLVPLFVLLVSFMYHGVDQRDFYSILTFQFVVYVFSVIIIQQSHQFQQYIDEELRKTNSQQLLEQQQQQNQEIQMQLSPQKSSHDKDKEMIRYILGSFRDSDSELGEQTNIMDCEQTSIQQNLHFEQQRPLQQQRKTTSQLLEEKQNCGFVQELSTGLECAKSAPIFLFLVYLITFSMFPGILISNVYFYIQFLVQDNQIVGTLLMITSFYFFDLIGRTMSTYQFFQHKFLLCPLVLIRFLFLFTGFYIAMQSQPYAYLDQYPFINMALFAMTNGLCTGGLQTISLQNAKDQNTIKAVVYTNRFSILFGICFGSIIGILQERLLYNMQKS